MPDGDMTRSITTLGPRKTEPAMGLGPAREGHVDGDLRPRHMVCPSAERTSVACQQCSHCRVHDENLACKQTIRCGGVCRPVTEANE
jgi:hypothetical protein